jgi:phosphonoacetate hydrolase
MNRDPKAWTSAIDILGGPAPHVYDPLASAAVLELGLKTLQKDLKDRPDMPMAYYLSTTDFLQHTYPPGHEQVNQLLSTVDSVLGKTII